MESFMPLAAVDGFVQVEKNRGNFRTYFAKYTKGVSKIARKMRKAYVPKI